MQVGQAAGDIVPVWGRVSSAWVIVIVEVGMILGPGGDKVKPGLANIEM